jgi:hypothetical protein
LDIPKDSHIVDRIDPTISGSAIEAPKIVWDGFKTGSHFCTMFFLPQISQYLFLLSLFNSTKSSRSLSIFVPKMTCQVAGVCNVAKGHFAGVVKKDVSSEALLGGRGLFCDSGGFWVVSSGKL